MWYDEIKRNKRHKNIEEEQELISEEDIEQTAISNNEREKLYKRIQNLDKQTKEVIYLRLTGELSFKEIGEILGKTENWARVTFYRGKQKLKEVD